MGPLPDERNSLLQRELAEMKITEVEAKRGPVHNHGWCWRVTDADGNEGFLCTKNVGQGEWSRSASGREPGKQVFYFVNKNTGKETDFENEQQALETLTKIPWE
jgi:hypothetical protein